jgi:hypothetical protein
MSRAPAGRASVILTILEPMAGRALRHVVRVRRDDDWWTLEFPEIADRVLGCVRDLRSAPTIAAEAITIVLESESGAPVFVRAADIDLRVG